MIPLDHLRDPEPPAATADGLARVRAIARRRRLRRQGIAGLLVAAVAASGLVLATSLDSTDDVVTDDPPPTTSTERADPPPAALLPVDPAGSTCAPRGIDASGLPSGVDITLGPAPTSTFVPALPGKYVVHWRQGGFDVELHYPVTSLIDLVGERTEDVRIGGRPALLWYGNGFVQLRRFEDYTIEDPCQSFDVTVVWCPPTTRCTLDRSTEAKGVALAVAEALRLVEPAADPRVEVVRRFVAAVKAADAAAADALVDERPVFLDELLTAGPRLVAIVDRQPTPGGLVGLQLLTADDPHLQKTPPCRFFAAVDDGRITNFTTCPAPPPPGSP